jgi:hypothetical protein
MLVPKLMNMAISLPTRPAQIVLSGKTTPLVRSAPDRWIAHLSRGDIVCWSFWAQGAGEAAVVARRRRENVWKNIGGEAKVEGD